MKKFTVLALICALILSATACSGISSGISSSDGPSTTLGDSGGASAPDSASTNEAVSGGETAQAPIEEIPYTLGGELTPTMLANSIYNKGNQARLARVIKKLQDGGEVVVAYLGGSITQGSSAGNELCYARLTTNWLEETFPSAKIRYLNAGIGATGSYIGVHRCDNDVLKYDPDLVFVDFSVNDGTDRTAMNQSTYESLMRKLWTYESAPAIVTIAMTQENGTSFQEYHGEIVKKYDIPMISYKNTILDVIGKGYIQWKDISDDNIHPNVPGHAILSGLLTSYLQDVIDNLDSIDLTEPELAATGESGMKYQNAKLLTSANTEPVSLGSFEQISSDFGGFSNPWFARSSDGFADESGIEFEVEAQNIGLLYGKLTSNAAMADIYVDGDLRMTLNANFPNGWGNYVEFAEICSFMSTGTHTIRIVPKSDGGAAAFYVSAIAVS